MWIGDVQRPKKLTGNMQTFGPNFAGCIESVLPTNKIHTFFVHFRSFETSLKIESIWYVRIQIPTN